MPGYNLEQSPEGYGRAERSHHAEQGALELLSQALEWWKVYAICLAASETTAPLSKSLKIDPAMKMERKKKNSNRKEKPA